MKRLSLVCLLALAACPGTNNNNNDAGSDAGNQGYPIITASGRAFIHPAAVEWMVDAGLPVPSVGGLTLSVDEPLKVALGNGGHFGAVTLDGDGGFSVSNIDTSQIILGLAAAISDPVCDGGWAPDAGCRVIAGASGIYDVTLTGLPQADVTGAKAYAVPTAFHDALTAAVTPAVIQNIAGNGITTLYNAGFMLGQIVDSSGHPVAGLKVNPTMLSSQFYYVSDDFKSVNQNQTGANGLFIFVDAATDMPVTFNMTVAGHSEYLARSAGAKKNAALILTVFPGTTAP